MRRRPGEAAARLALLVVLIGLAVIGLGGLALLFVAMGVLGR